MTEPTDAEIIALADETRTAEGGANGYVLPISFARAVLAKFGTPPAVAGQLADEQIEDLLECGNPTDEEKRLIRMGWDAARNAQAVQAGAVPLTAYQIHEAIKAFKDSENLMGVNHIHIARAIEHAHGIKGGQRAE